MSDWLARLWYVRARIGPFQKAFETKTYGNPRKSFRDMNGFDSTRCGCVLRPAEVGCGHREEAVWGFRPCAAHLRFRDEAHALSANVEPPDDGQDWKAMA